jgi:hypothetical protein
MQVSFDPSAFSRTWRKKPSGSAISAHESESVRFQISCACLSNATVALTPTSDVVQTEHSLVFSAIAIRVLSAYDCLLIRSSLHSK